MIITPKFDCAEGEIDTDTDKLYSISSADYAPVFLAFKATGSFVTFARIKLHSRDTVGDSKETHNDAVALGIEIARRWNEYQQAMNYAKMLVQSIHKKNYQQDNPNWKPLDDLVGILTQIDNQCAGMDRKETNAHIR
jgi:hypothetical protein